MFDLVPKLVDRLISFANLRRETNRALFADFVVPAIDDFNAVHQNYLDTFRRYRDMIKSEEYELNLDHPIFDAIKEDHLFSQDLRTKLRHFYSTRFDKQSAPLADALYGYLHAAARDPTDDTLNDDAAWNSNISRARLRDGVRTTLAKSQDQEALRRQSLAIIDWLVTGLQRRYDSVNAEFESLKVEMLNGP